MSDTFHRTMSEAMAEAARRRAAAEGKDFLVRVEESPYGGYRVKSIPADLFIDQLADGPISGFIGLKHLLGT